MKFWIGLTDKNWYEFLKRKEPDEVNFWQPSAARRAVVLEPGALFLFKLHAPDNFIVGGGFYVRYSALPAQLAWSAFAEKNGVRDYSELRNRVVRYRREPVVGDPEIGCHVLNAPFFWNQEDWIPTPASWAGNIVQGKTFDSESSDGLRIWRMVQDRLQAQAPTNGLGVQSPRFGQEYLARARLGQGAFRVLVTDAYERRCAVSGEKTLPVLEAAHIRPYSEEGPHSVRNGLLLRSDIHTLFDLGYLSVAEDMRVVVSKRIREEFSNGRAYYQFDGKTLENQPRDQQWKPGEEYLAWHREHRFLG